MEINLLRIDHIHQVLAVRIRTIERLQNLECLLIYLVILVQLKLLKFVDAATNLELQSEYILIASVAEVFIPSFQDILDTFHTYDQHLRLSEA